MKRYIVIKVAAVVAVLFVATVASAREWYINNKDGVPAHFADINAAMASEEVIEGDTLYIGAGCVISSNQTISKKVTVIGTGWGYSDSPVAPAKINGHLYISGAGTRVLGLYVNGDIQPRANDIVIERCRFSSVSNWRVNTYLYNVKILSSYLNRIHANVNSTKYNIGWQVIGNIIVCNSDDGACYALNNALVENNVIIYKYNDKAFYYGVDCVIRNNIIINTFAPDAILYVASGCRFYDNVVSAASGYEGNTMLGNSVLTDIFNCTGSVESGEYYSLKEGSPAIGAGEGGIDCGVMVGAYKFIPYGRPQYIPVIKEAVVPSIPTDGKVKVSFKIENQND